MTILDAVILGLVEGITEFLPISSTGHLRLAQWLLGLDGDPQVEAAVKDFTIIIQGGAILAVALVYWPRLRQMLRGLRGRDAAGLKLCINLGVAFLPAAVLGLLLERAIEKHLLAPIPVLAALGLGGVLLLVIGPWQRRLYGVGDDSDRFRSLDELSWKQALIIGLFQCVAMWPGTSRSMMTIVGGMLVGLRPRHAAEFSFLLGVPTLGGACVYKLAKHLRGDPSHFIDSLGGPLPMLIGIAVAAVSAAFAVRWLVGYLSRHGLTVFGWYRLALCGVIGIALWQGWIALTPAPTPPMGVTQPLGSRPHEGPRMFSAAAPIVLAAVTLADPTPAAQASTSEPIWVGAERGILENHVQLTFPDRFIKAGESYFSPDDSRVIFQAVEQPADGGVPEEFYGMFVGDVVWKDGHITGLANIRRISPPGSANTCGWFHPTDPNTVIFATTITPPHNTDAPGYRRGTGRYQWMFPKEMRIVSCDLRKPLGDPASLTTLAGDGTAYTAEGSLDPTAQWLLYCSLEGAQGDLMLREIGSGADARLHAPMKLVSAGGYDGGPFFSPDGKRICYRSDRRGDNLLQLFVGELRVDADGRPTGLDREFQLTDDEHVNWCPFWHPDGRHLVFATSRMGHENYEIFIIDADAGATGNKSRPTRYGTELRRVTHADGADVLPAFTSDGKTMIWTTRRDSTNTVQLWAARFVMDLASPRGPSLPARSSDEGKPKQVTIKDPDSDAVYIYDIVTHTVRRYDPKTHVAVDVTNQAELDKVLKLFKSGAAQNP